MLICPKKRTQKPQGEIKKKRKIIDNQPYYAYNTVKKCIIQLVQLRKYYLKYKIKSYIVHNNKRRSNSDNF